MKKAVFAALLFSLPLFASAQALAPLQTLVASVGRLVASLVPILITLTMIIFFWGLFKYVRDSGKGHDAGKKIMVAGLGSLFVMVSIWGIINLAQGALNVNPNAPVQSPGVPVPGAYGNYYNGSADNTTGVNGYTAPGYNNTNSYGGPR